MDEDDYRGLLCPACFADPGLSAMARSEASERAACPNCGAVDEALLDREQLTSLTWRFFVLGSIHRTAFGGAPTIQFSEAQSGSIGATGPLGRDVALLQTALGIGFFHYGPRLWMLGHIEPLEDLTEEKTRVPVIRRILDSYPSIDFGPEQTFSRVRKAPSRPESATEYDAPPPELSGNGRLDRAGAPVLYGSQDLEICVHESRFAAGDELFVATMRPLRTLRLLNLNAVLEEQGTEFESLDLAVHMLFLAGSHAYDVTRQIAADASTAGFDGIAYPSFFSLLRTGGVPFETHFGLSLRRFASEYEQSKIITNLALFGRPVLKGSVSVVGINRLIINSVRYGLSFGPVGV